MSTKFVTFSVLVHVLEDLHIGSGLGGADVDALLARDREGRPVVRWSHFRGLLKQALIDRCTALGEDPGSKELVLFGRSHLVRGAQHERGALQGRSLRLVSAAGIDPRRSIVWGSTARQPGSRVPKTDTLRRVEFVPADTKFQGELRVPDRNGWPDLVGKLLQRMNRLGGDRSRGAGLVCLKAESGRIDPPALQPDPKVQAAQPAGHRLLFKALDPVALGATGSPGNLIRGHSHMAPGAVHGMLVRWALTVGCTELADALLDRRIACGPAYPLPPSALKESVNKLESTPFPLSFQAPKPAGQPGTWPWWATHAVSEGWKDTLTDKRKSEGEGQEEKLKRPGAHDYLVRINSRWERFRCEPGEAMRNDAGSGQRAFRSQQLFSQEEVPEDTGFISRVVALDTEAERLLRPALQVLQAGKHWLQAGRGGTPLVLAGHCEVVESIAWPGVAGMPETVVRLLVESDLILRAEDFRFRTRLDRAAVLHLLRLAGAQDDWLNLVTTGLKIEEVSESTEVRGRNISTGGPRLPALAIRRGSEAELHFATKDQADHCRRLFKESAAHGLGERAAEGHGRLRLDFAPAYVLSQAEEGLHGTNAAIALNAAEALLAAAMTWQDRSGFPSAFTTKRWQDLRNAARAQGAQPFLTWISQAQREASRLAERGSRGPADGGASWLVALQEEVGQLATAQRDLLRTIGLLAAKRCVADRREREDLRHGDKVTNSSTATSPDRDGYTE